jgi:hypothetical protein
MPTTTEAPAHQQERETAKAIGSRVESLLSSHPAHRTDDTAALRSFLDDRSAAIIVWEELLRTRKTGSSTLAMAGICALFETLCNKDKSSKVGREQCCMILGRLCCSRSKAVVIAKVKRCKVVSGLVQALSTEEICPHAKQAASWALRRLTEVSNKMRTDLCGSREFLVAAAKIISGHSQPSSLYFKPGLLHGLHNTSATWSHATPSSSRRSSTHVSPTLQPEDMHMVTRQHRKIPSLEQQSNTNGEARTLSVHTISRRLSMPDFSPIRGNNVKSPNEASMLPPLIQRVRSQSVVNVNDVAIPERTFSQGSACSSARTSPTCSPTLSHSGTAPVGMLPPLAHHAYDDASYSSMPVHWKHAHERTTHRGQIEGEIGFVCCVRVRLCVYVCVCVCVCARMHICTHERRSLCKACQGQNEGGIDSELCAHAFMYVCMCSYVYV